MWQKKIQTLDQYSFIILSIVNSSPVGFNATRIASMIHINQFDAQWADLIVRMTWWVGEKGSPLVISLRLYIVFILSIWIKFTIPLGREKEREKEIKEHAEKENREVHYQYSTITKWGMSVKFSWGRLDSVIIVIYNTADELSAFLTVDSLKLQQWPTISSFYSWLSPQMITMLLKYFCCHFLTSQDPPDTWDTEKCKQRNYLLIHSGWRREQEHFHELCNLLPTVEIKIKNKINYNEILKIRK